MTNVTVLGAGAWGTAFGQVLADAGNNVTMWAIEPEIVEGIRDHHHNGVRLPSVKVLPSNMTATGDRAEAVANADIVIVAIAAQFARVALVEFKDLIPETALVASLMKGIERTTGKRMDEVVMENARPAGRPLRRDFRTEPEQADRRPRAGRNRGRLRKSRQCAQDRSRLHHRLFPCVRNPRRDRLGNVRIAEECGRAGRGHGPRRRLRRKIPPP